MSANGIVRPERRGPMEGEAVMGVDTQPERRPGVPRAKSPAPVEAVADRPISPQRPGRDTRLHRAALDEPTPVFGTAQPHRGVSGALRKAAYRIPEHRKRHWMLLLLADRVNAAEAHMGEALVPPAGDTRARRAAEQVRAHPVLALGAAAAGVWLARRVRA